MQQQALLSAGSDFANMSIQMARAKSHDLQELGLYSADSGCRVSMKNTHSELRGCTGHVLFIK